MKAQHTSERERQAKGRGGILLLIPAFNAAASLDHLITRIRMFAADDDILVINDGSTDNTEAILSRLGIRHVMLPENFGKGEALKTGFRHAIENGYRSVITIDADLQHLPEEIPRFMARDNGSRLLLGRRDISPKSMPFHRWVSNTLTSLILSGYASRRIRDSQCGFRLIPVTLLKTLVLDSSRFDVESELLFKAIRTNIEIEEIPVSTIYNESKSAIHPVRDTMNFIVQMWKSLWR